MRKMDSTLRDTLCEILGMHPDEVSASTSLQHVTYAEWAAILLSCEAAFSITLHDEIVCDLHTVGDLMRAVRDCVSDGPLDSAQPNDVQREAWYYE